MNFIDSNVSDDTVAAPETLEKMKPTVRTTTNISPQVVFSPCDTDALKSQSETLRSGASTGREEKRR